MMAAALLSMFDRSTMPPMLGAMAAGLDTTIAEVGAALAVFSIAYAGSQLPWSAVSSRLGQVRVLRIALGVAAASRRRRGARTRSPTSRRPPRWG